MHSPGDVAIVVLMVVGLAGWLSMPLRRVWERDALAPPPAVVQLPPLARARHPRLELELHEHRHWGLKRSRFAHGQHAGWTLHLGYGRGCICVDLYRRGRRP